MDTQEAQAINASNNPNIVSDLYTGSTGETTGGTTLQAPPQQAMAIPGMEQATNVATNMANELYGSQFVPGMESQRNAMIQELMDYDGMLDKIYSGQSFFNPVEGYVSNPADMFRGVGGVSGQTSSDITRVASTIDATERAYNMAIGNVMDKMMDFMAMQQDQNRWEKEYELKKAQATGAGADEEKDRMAMAILFGADPNAVASGDAVTAMATATGAPTPKTLAQASMYNSAGTNKYLSLFSAFNEGGGATGLSEGEQKELRLKQDTKQQLQNLWSLYQRVPSYQKGRFGQSTIGSVMQGLGSENLYDQFDQQKRAIAQNIAKSVYGDTGQVNQAVIDNIVASLPSLGESEKSATERMTRLLNDVDSSIARLTGGQTQYDAFQGGQQIPGYTTNYSPSEVYAGGGTTASQPIPVIHLESGQAGWLDPTMYDPSLYEKI